jgi:PHP family Zn ribbon phosphoesterase
VKELIQSCKKCGIVNWDSAKENEKCSLCGGEMKPIFIREKIEEEKDEVERP